MDAAKLYGKHSYRFMTECLPNDHVLINTVKGGVHITTITWSRKTGAYADMIFRSDEPNIVRARQVTATGTEYPHWVDLNTDSRAWEIVRLQCLVYYTLGSDYSYKDCKQIPVDISKLGNWWVKVHMTIGNILGPVVDSTWDIRLFNKQARFIYETKKGKTWFSIQGEAFGPKHTSIGVPQVTTIGRT